MRDLKGKSRGYGFIEFKHKEDASEVYRKANGIWIDDWKVLVDWESGRVDKDFRPWRLGEGYGKNFRHSDSEAKLIKEIIKKYKDGIWKRDLKAELKQYSPKPKEELILETQKVESKPTEISASKLEEGELEEGEFRD